jgi:hypothetical protein
MKLTAILLVMMSPGRLSGHAAAVFLRRLESSTFLHGPREGPLFYLWLSVNSGIG